MKTLVIGGAGLVGSLVVEELVKRGVNVRVFARKKSAVADADKTGVEVVEGDLLDPVTVEKALDGVDKLYLLNAVAPDELTQGLIAYDLARKHRLQHVVYHSVFRAEHFLDVPHFASKVAIENALKAFDVPWTIIRPNYFFQNDAKLRDVIKGAGLYPMPLGPTGISLVDSRHRRGRRRRAGGRRGTPEQDVSPQRTRRAHRSRSRSHLESVARQGSPLLRGQHGGFRSAASQANASVVGV